MATLLKTDAAGLNELASRYQKRIRLFHAVECLPKLAAAAAQPRGSPRRSGSINFPIRSHADSGRFINGRPIHGSVLFLGGLLHFMPELGEAYKRILTGATDFITPPNGQLYGDGRSDTGGVRIKTQQLVPLADLGSILSSAKDVVAETRRSAPVSQRC